MQDGVQTMPATGVGALRIYKSLGQRHLRAILTITPLAPASILTLCRHICTSRSSTRQNGWSPPWPLLWPPRGKRSNSTWPAYLFSQKTSQKKMKAPNSFDVMNYILAKKEFTYCNKLSL
ncbi:hypothetical protein AAHE18_14G198200 [Arachis hypogaea]